MHQTIRFELEFRSEIFIRFSIGCCDSSISIYFSLKMLAFWMAENGGVSYRNKMNLPILNYQSKISTDSKHLFESELINFLSFLCCQIAKHDFQNQFPPQNIIFSIIKWTSIKLHYNQRFHGHSKASRSQQKNFQCWLLTFIISFAGNSHTFWPS